MLRQPIYRLESCSFRTDRNQEAFGKVELNGSVVAKRQDRLACVEADCLLAYGSRIDKSVPPSTSSPLHLAGILAGTLFRSCVRSSTWYQRSRLSRSATASIKQSVGTAVLAAPRPINHSSLHCCVMCPLSRLGWTLKRNTGFVTGKDKTLQPAQIAQQSKTGGAEHQSCRLSQVLSPTAVDLIVDIGFFKVNDAFNDRLAGCHVPVELARFAR